METPAFQDERAPRKAASLVHRFASPASTDMRIFFRPLAPGASKALIPHGLVARLARRQACRTGLANNCRDSAPDVARISAALIQNGQCHSHRHAGLSLGSIVKCRGDGTVRIDEMKREGQLTPEQRIRSTVVFPPGTEFVPNGSHDTAELAKS